MMMKYVLWEVVNIFPDSRKKLGSRISDSWV